MIANNPLVSVIVPVYNVEKYIGWCIESIQKQTLEDWELILVDDCGGDLSMTIVKEYASKDNRIQYIESEKNVGPMVAREKGYKKAKGSFITFVDSDDYLPPNALELLCAKQDETGADIVAGNLTRVEPDGTTYISTNELPYGTSPENVFKALLNVRFNHHLVDKLYKRSLFDNYDYINVNKMRNGEDACLFFQLVSNAQKIECINNNVYYYISTPNSSTNIKKTKKQLDDRIYSIKFRYNICSKYDSLKEVLDCYVTRELVENIATYKPMRTVLDVVRKYELSHYVNPFHVINILSFKEVLRYFKWFLFNRSNIHE